MVEPLFTKEHIDGMRPHIQQTVDSLLDALIRNGGETPVDIVEKFALPVASHVSYSAYRHSAMNILTQRPVLVRRYMAFLGFHSKISPTSLSRQRYEAMEAPQLPRRQMPIRQ